MVSRTVATLVMALLPIAAGLLFPQPRVIPAPFNLLGLLLLAGGVALVLWTWWTMKASGTTLSPTEASRCLVTSGPFRVSRNPMYLGTLLAVIGECAVVGSLIGFVFPVIYFVGIDRFVESREEAAMSRQFDDAYSQYKRRVRRWL
jgi:protein-S-isoprenylcysteine O-methyltransferase Ste14